MKGTARIPFRFERTRLLHRLPEEELWEGTVDGQVHLLRRIRKPQAGALDQLLFASRIRHPLLLPCNGVKISGDGTIHQLLETASVSTEVPEDFPLKSFLTNLISLTYALQNHNRSLRWNPCHVFYNNGLKDLSLAALDLISCPGPAEIRKNESRFLLDLSRWLGSRGESSLAKILHPNRSGRSNPLRDCLHQLLSGRTSPRQENWLALEIPRSKELELVAGLYRLAEQSQGRVLLYASDAGEGKSNLLLQIQRTLSQRGASVFLSHATEGENRPLHTARRLLDLFCEEAGAYRLLRRELPILRAMEGTGEWSEELLVRAFRKLLSKRLTKGIVQVFLLDDAHLFDIASIHMLHRLFRQIQDLPVLFVLTSRKEMPELGKSVTHLSLNPITLSAYNDAWTIPLWQNSQRNSYIQQIFSRTSGNPQLFLEYLKETFRQRSGTVLWDDGEWKFHDSQIPSLPDALMDFYLNQIPELTAQELEFLESVSVQGETFDPSLMNAESVLLESLILKGMIRPANDRFGFQRPLLSEAFYKRIEPERRKRYHLRIAEILKRQNTPGKGLEIARHFLKAEEYSRALAEAIRAKQNLVAGAEPEALALFEDLQQAARKLKPHERLILHQQLGKLLFQKGKYPAAIFAFSNALPLAGNNRSLRFEISLYLAESYLMSQSMRSAQEILQEQSKYVSKGSDEALRFRFYFARGICSSHRGPSADEDLERAFEIAKSRQDYFSLAHGYRRYAEIVLQNGHLKEAFLLSRKAFRYAQKLRNLDEIGHLYRIRASISWHESRFLKAETFLKKSMQLFEKAQNDHGLALDHSLLGNIRKEQYRFTEAIEAFREACTLFARLENPLDVSLAQFNLGLVYLEQGKLDEAEKIFCRCREQDRKSGYKRYYAYDLRALAATSILRGHYKKTGKLLQSSLAIFQELNAKSDVLQTQLYLLMNEMEQKNYRQAAPVIEWLLQELPVQTDPFTRADIHYLLGFYYIFTGDEERASENISRSLRLARKNKYWKLLAKNLILNLILRNSLPAAKNRALFLAEKYYRKSASVPDFAEDYLRLYQAYPELLKQRIHSNRLSRLEKIYRSFRNKMKHNLVRELAQSISESKVVVEPLFDWWKQVLEILRSNEELEDQLQKVLQELSSEFHSSYCFVQYLGDHGTFEREVFPKDFPAAVEDDLFSAVSARMMQFPDGICLDLRQDAEFVSSSWRIVHNVISILAIPFLKDGQLAATWYLERRDQEPVFTIRDLHKARFFSTAVMPILETALEKEFRRRRQPYDLIRAPYPDLLGRSKAMHQVFQQMQKVSTTDVSVLILGESGTGKELVARNIHRNSNKRSGPFQVINCGSIPETLVESELFGHNKGAFTGAVHSRQGYVERAASGTLFMDEIGELSLTAQAKLLRVIQEKEIQRLGDTVMRRVDVRFLFATHQDLTKMVRDGTFREDLYYRVAVATLNVPALRERKEDVPVLAEHFLAVYRQSFGKGNVRITPAAMRCMRDYSWPGNVRELENVVQSILINCDSGGTIDAGDLPSSITENRFLKKLSGTSLEEARREFERAFLVQALDRHGWNKTQTARDLKITRQGLIHMIQRLGIQERK